MADRVLAITGASSGIGAATARLARDAGLRLVLMARSLEKLTELADELGPDHALAIACDVTNADSVKGAFARAAEHYPRIDAVFANAGIGGVPGGYSDGDPEVWKDLVLTNVYGLALTVHHALPSLKASKGHLVITSSVAGRRTLEGSMYGITKWAATALGYNVREELRGTGIRVTLVEPGMVDTPFFDEPKPQALKPEDIARSVMFALQQPASVDVHEMVVLPTPAID